MTDPIHAAIKYADREEHGGAGFYLEVQTAAGAVNVDVYQKDGLPYLLRRRDPEGARDCEDIFFNPAQVISATVIF